MHPVILRRGALPSTLMALCATCSHAQAPARDADPGVQTLPGVTVNASADASAGGLKPPYAGGQVARGGRVGILGSQDIMDTPFSTTNYTQMLIQDRQAASIGDVLRNDPAVRVARGFGNFQQVYIIRGFPVFSDDMAYNGLYGLLPRQYLAAELVERVEVLHGASAFLNGAAPGGSGLGGAISVMPKRAPNEPLNEVTLGVASGGELYGAADIARRFGPNQSGGLRLNAVRREGDTAVDNEQRRLSLLSLGGDFHTGGFRLSADIGNQDHKQRASQPNVTFASGVPILPPPDARHGLAQPWTFSNERDTFGTVRGEYDVASNVTAWAAYGFRRGDEATDLALPTVTDPAGDITALRFTGSRVDRISTGEIGVRAKLQTGPVGHTVVASVATYSGKTDAPFNFSAFGPAFLGTIASNLYAPVANPPPTADAFPGDTVTHTKTSSEAVADTMSFLQDSLLVTLGARNQRIANDTYGQSKVTPVGGIVYKASRMLSVYGTYIEGLVQGDTAPALAGRTPVVNAGQQFAPFQTKQGELGVKLDTGRLGGTFSVFTAKKPIYSVSAANVFEQTDSQRNRGAELSVFGEAMPGLKLLGGASYLATDVAGQNAIGAPRWQMNLGVDWAVPGVHGLALDAQVVHTAQQFADAANTQIVPSWSSLDIGARYVLTIGTQEVTLRARVNNATGRNYWASSGGYPGAGYLVLGDPRNFVLSGTVSF